MSQVLPKWVARTFRRLFLASNIYGTGATICSPCSPVWDSATPSPSWLALVCNVKGLFQSGQTRTGVVVSLSLWLSKALCCSSLQSHLAFFLSSKCRGVATWAMSLINRRYHDISPRKRRASLKEGLNLLLRLLCSDPSRVHVGPRCVSGTLVLSGRICISPGSASTWRHTASGKSQSVLPGVSGIWWYIPLCRPGTRMRKGPVWCDYLVQQSLESRRCGM